MLKALFVSYCYLITTFLRQKDPSRTKRYWNLTLNEVSINSLSGIIFRIGNPISTKYVLIYIILNFYPSIQCTSYTKKILNQFSNKPRNTKYLN